MPKFKGGRRCGVTVGKYLSLARRRLEITLSMVSPVNPEGVGRLPRPGVLYRKVPCILESGMVVSRLLWYRDCFLCDLTFGN
jgi:hypothetical protein